MCSIAGIVGKKEKGSIENMIRAQQHRAPDEEGFYRDEMVELGMGRLKIIDLSSPGLAPYQEDGFVLCYNGEIYNYQELKKELKDKGYVFKTTSDTEVLLKSWREWGLDMFNKLNGMFAFAIYDSNKKQLILARDIAGEKPLYYFYKGNTLIFSSEAKAILEVIDVRAKKNQFFESFQHCFLTTLWENINELPPASFLTIDIPTNKIVTRHYWEFKPRQIDLRTAEEELQYLLNDSIKLRTKSDVPIGLYRSGGLDSSLIESYYSFDHAFYFDNQNPVLRDEFFQKINKVLWHLDFPVGSFGFFGMWKLAEAASKKVKVVISGEGSDEIFGGYVRYMPIATEYYLKRHFPSYDYLFSKYFSSSYLNSFANITKRNENVDYVVEQLRPFFEKFEDPINAMNYADFKLIFPSLLQMGDRMAGAFGLENRCPFLDRRIIEFGFSLPPEYKIKNFEQKVILRRIAKKIGLLDSLSKEKHGLTILYNKWVGEQGWDRSKYFEFLKEIWNKVYMAQ